MDQGQRGGLSLRDTALMLGVATATVLLLGSGHLASWASRLPYGPAHDVANTCVGPIARADSRLGLDRPATLLRQATHRALGMADEAGWEGATSGVPVAAGPESATGESSVESSPAPRPIYSPGRPLRVLMLGDSLLGDGFGTSLEEAVARDPAMRGFRKCTVSSGLTRPDFYSWPREATQLIERERPDVIVGIIGINDVQGVLFDGSVVQYGESEWPAAYERLAAEYINLLADHSEMLYWIALPPMRDRKFRDAALRMNPIFERICSRRADVRFVATEGLLGDAQGNYTAYLTIDGKRALARAGDGVHISRQAGMLMAEAVLALVERDFAILRETPESSAEGAGPVDGPLVAR